MKITDRNSPLRDYISFCSGWGHWQQRCRS